MQKERPIFAEEAAVAYLCAVTAAAFTFAVLRFILDASGVWLELPNSFESATSHSFGRKMQHLRDMAIIGFFIEWFVTALAGAIPFTFGIVYANEFGKRHWFYFVGGAAITSFCLFPLLWAMIDPIREPDFDPEAARHAFLAGVPMFMVSGAMAGLACWLVLRGRSLQS